MTSRGAKFWDSGAIPLIAPEILGDIIGDVADLAIVISDNCEILSVIVNPANPSFLVMEHWEGKDIRDSLAVESRPKFESRLAAFMAGDKDVKPVELNHSRDVSDWDSPVRYSFHRIAPDGAILMLGRDLRAIAEMQQQLIRAQLALERDYEVQREYDTRFRVLLNNMSEPVLFVGAQNGDITEANAAATTLFDRSRDDLIGSPLLSCFEARKRGDLIEALTTLAISECGDGVKIELRGKSNVVQIMPTLFRAAGERVLLCRIIPDVEDGLKADNLARNMQDLYLSGPEAIVFASENGDVLSANDAFLDLIDVAHDINVRGRSIADYLQRGSVDLKVMTENATRSGRMRMYATKIAGQYGSPRAVEISVTKLHAGTHSVFAFVMRDTNHADTTRGALSPTSDESMKSVVELVGSATLRDIVAETTNVVEKMCIETAVSLTMNNRVAAAEMLGLSRQSLYVKLRKFDLLSRDTDDR
ncbi:transcriptional regulator PpsR [Yoonia sp.]|uniref:transcriptional regulator PpsR n=1 Tax=Yoonia sp. TaxID=2212373 RepID=UPI003918DBBD